MSSPSYLLQFAREGKTQVVEFSKEQVVIGRAEGCDLSFPTAEGMSRQHAAINREADAWFLVDLSSRNGTFVNKSKLTDKHRLADGDTILIGSSVFRYTLPKPKVTQSSLARETVEFSDDAGKPNVTASFNMNDLDRVLGGGPGSASINKSLLSGAKVGVIETEPAPAPIGGGAWIINLFRQAGEALLQANTLDQLLDKVMDLVFNVTPAERGFIALYDEPNNKVQPKIMRTRSAKSDPRIKVSKTILGEVLRAKNAVLVADAQSDERFSGAVSIMQMNIQSAMCCPLYHNGQVKGFIYADSMSSMEPFTTEHLQVLTALALFSAVGVEQTVLREKIVEEQKIRDRLARYSSPGVVDQIVNNVNFAADMVAEEKEATVIFSDLSGFTSMSEHMAPPDVARVLNSVFEGLTDSIFAFDGTLDKYMGDGMMAIFGAPLGQENHAERAVRAALQMFERLHAFNATSGSDKKIAMRVGINTGRVVAGDIGSPRRKDYTVIGDTVNVASRLESSVAKPGHVVIGPLTYEAVKHLFDCQPLEEIQLKGKQIKVRPYLVIGPKS